MHTMTKCNDVDGTNAREPPLTALAEQTKRWPESRAACRRGRVLDTGGFIGAIRFSYDVMITGLEMETCL